MPISPENRIVATSAAIDESVAYNEAANRLGITTSEFIRRACHLALMVDKLRERPADFVVMQCVNGESGVVGQHMIPPELL